MERPRGAFSPAGFVLNVALHPGAPGVKARWMMRSSFVVLAAAAVLALPSLAHATGDDDDRKDRHGDYDRDRDRYHDRDRDEDRDRHHDRDRRRDHDRYGDCDGYRGCGYDDGDRDHDRRGGRHRDRYDDRDHDYDYDDYGDRYDHGKNRCPHEFDLVLAFIDYEADHDEDGVICCKLVGHDWQKKVVCVDRDDAYDFEDDHRRDYD